MTKKVDNKRQIQSVKQRRDKSTWRRYGETIAHKRSLASSPPGFLAGLKCADAASWSQSCKYKQRPTDSAATEMFSFTFR